MKKTFVALVLLSIIVSGAVCLQPIKAQYRGNIVIDDDGGISPSTAPIRQTDNVYTLTGNVEGDITIYRSNMVLDGNGSTIAGGLFLNAKANVTAKNLVITTGAQLLSSDNNFIMGILVNGVSNTIANNTITDVWSVEAMNAIEFAGLAVEGGGYNLITGNNFANNLVGMDFSHTSHNLIVGNSIIFGKAMFGMLGSGIYFTDASNNTIYHNNFRINGVPVGDLNSVNVWDDGYPGGGNYWSDYHTRYTNAAEIDNSGISNTPYVIDAQNEDRYPLDLPFTVAFLTNYEQEITPPKISVFSPQNQTYTESNVSLAFAIDKTPDWVGYSLDAQQNITITSAIKVGSTINETLVNLPSGHHTISIYANNSFGYMSSSGTINFTVAAPSAVTFPTSSVVAVSTVIVVVAAGLLVYIKRRKHLV